MLVETEVPCPHCGEINTLAVDTSQEETSMIEDCTVCCRPMAIGLTCEPGEVLEVRAEVA
jgi:Cysteine-rich CPXCG